MPALRKIEYGAPTDKNADAVRLGIEKGIFEQEGLDLSVKVVFGGPQIAAAYDSGELQIGEIGSPPAIDAMAAGLPVKIVASGCRQRAHMFFGIGSFEELKGKRLGLLGIGSCPDWIARSMKAEDFVDLRFRPDFSVGV
jgi:NitT/TauT family transport system substrate-binding protein